MSHPVAEGVSHPVAEGTSAPVTVGLLHTVPALAATFDGLVAAAAPQLRRVHAVDGWLLATARREGVTPAVQDAVAAHIRHLESVGAAAVLVTCSSIGEAAERVAAGVTVPVLRVDAPMAADAVARAAVARAANPGSGGRIAVLATLRSTLGPTGRLVRRAAGTAGERLEVDAAVVPGAAEAADGGDRARADALVAAAVREAAASADVIVLAQASMAGAAEQAGVDVPVLSSPAGGVRALLDAVHVAPGLR